jgi:hypothetical protein
MRTRTIIAASMLLTFQSEASFAESKKFTTIWMVADPLDKSAQVEGGTPQNLKLKSGDIFLKHRLLPQSAAKLETDIVDEKGSILLQKNSEMFSLEAGAAKIFCSVNQSKPNLGMSILIGSTGFGHVCAIDHDADGRFDAHFKAKGLVEGLPSISGRVPKAPKVVTSGAYTEIAPAQMITQYFVGIEYEGKPLIYNRRNFRITFGEGKRNESLSDWRYVSGKDYPQSLELLDSKFTVLGEKDGEIDVRIDRSIPAQPFNVFVRISYR